MGFRDTLVRQFERPEGALGGIAGWIMATRPSNVRRNLWTVGLLGVRPGDRILEIGCGPGVALKACAEQAKLGVVVGVDHSQAMLAQAARRNRRAIARGRVQLQLGGLDLVSTLGGAFDKVFLVNVVQFLADKVAAFRIFHEAMAPGGTLATTYQPRHRNPTRADAIRVADEIKEIMAAGQFEAISVEELQLRPVPALCVLGRKAVHTGSANHSQQLSMRRHK